MFTFLCASKTMSRVRGVHIPYVNLDWFMVDENLDELKQVITVTEAHSKAASRNGALAMMKYLVESRQLKPDFFEACSCGSLDMVKYAISVLGSKSVDYNAGLQIACSRNYVDLAKYLFDFASKPSDVVYDYLYNGRVFNMDILVWLITTLKMDIEEEMLNTVDDVNFVTMFFKPTMRLPLLLVNAAGKDNVALITFLYSKVVYTPLEAARAFVEACRLGRLESMAFLLPKVGRIAKVRGLNHALINGQLRLARRLYKASDLIKSDVIVRGLPAPSLQFVSTMLVV
jgi:hypothetical protein